MKIALTIIVAVLAGAAWVLVLSRTGRRRSKPRPAPEKGAHSGPPDTEAVLSAYRRKDYEAVVALAPAAIQALDAGTPEGATWRRRLELISGHSHFELDHFTDAVALLESGLGTEGGDDDETAPEQTARARFMHCLGFAHHRIGNTGRAREIYDELLADQDLDPAIRTLVEQNLDGLDTGLGDGRDPGS